MLKCMCDILKFDKQTHNGHLESVLVLFLLSSCRKSGKLHKIEKGVL